MIVAETFTSTAGIIIFFIFGTQLELYREWKRVIRDFWKQKVRGRKNDDIDMFGMVEPKYPPLRYQTPIVESHSSNIALVRGEYEV